MLSIIKANYLQDYKIFLEFNDKKSGIIDLKDFVFNTKLKPFHKLQNIEKFRNFKLDYTIKWGDLDLAPEYLYFKAFENDKELQPQFKEWGYIA